MFFVYAALVIAALAFFVTLVCVKPCVTRIWVTKSVYNNKQKRETITVLELENNDEFIEVLIDSATEETVDIKTGFWKVSMFSVIQNYGEKQIKLSYNPFTKTLKNKKIKYMHHKKWK